MPAAAAAAAAACVLCSRAVSARRKVYSVFCSRHERPGFKYSPRYFDPYVDRMYILWPILTRWGHCTTSRKVVGLRPNEVLKFYKFI
jgi:hypothetical protein